MYQNSKRVHLEKHYPKGKKFRIDRNLFSSDIAKVKVEIFSEQVRKNLNNEMRQTLIHAKTEKMNISGNTKEKLWWESLSIHQAWVFVGMSKRKSFPCFLHICID